MKLYGSYTSPFVRHCRVVLLEMGLPCEFVETQGSSTANKSPTMRVPYLEDGQLGLSDSSSILRYLREKSGSPFLKRVEDFDSFCLVNTLLDAAVNIFLFERTDGLMPEQSKYLTRQAARVESSLVELNGRIWPLDLSGDDAAIRLACCLAWGRFRNRFTFHQHPRLVELLTQADTWEPFAKTAPPEGV